MLGLRNLLILIKLNLFVHLQGDVFALVVMLLFIITVERV
jgi:hypothetical protein